VRVLEREGEQRVYSVDRSKYGVVIGELCRLVGRFPGFGPYN